VTRPRPYPFWPLMLLRMNLTKTCSVLLCHFLTRVLHAMTNLGFTVGLHKLSVPSFEILQEVFMSTPHPCSPAS
jgi:hypothetical protein